MTAAARSGSGGLRTTLRRGVSLLPPEQRGRWLALVPLMLLTAAFEAAGAAAIFGFIRIVIDPAAATALPVAGAILRRLPPLGATTTTVVSAVLVAAFYVAKNGLGVVAAWAQARCVNESTAATSVALLRGYLAAPWSFHLQRRSSDLVHDAHQAVGRIYRRVLAPALGIVTESLVALAIVAVLLVAAPRVTLVAVAVLLVLSLGLLRVTRGATLRLGGRVDLLMAAALGHLQQALGAVKELKVLGREGAVADAYAADRRRLARVRTRYGTLAALPRLVVETIFVCGALLVVILLAARGGTVAETMPLLGLYAYAGFRVIPSVNRILGMIGDVRYGSGAVERVARTMAALPAAAPAAARPCPFRDRVALERVSFAYGCCERAVLRDVDLAIRRGERIGVVGRTGAGKSTLLDLVTGVLEPTRGRITVDGVALGACVSGWQRGIGYVPQSVFLLDDTLRRNVALGVPDAEIDDARLTAAIDRAQLRSVVEALPAGLDSRLGERGARLSGGERQRVGIARALYAAPRLLVFDEATSALDAATEAALVDALRTLAGVTMLIVAHRLTSLRHCDRLVLVADGRIADVGAYDELARRSPEFRSLAALAEAEEGQRRRSAWS